jgi:integrase
LRLERGITKGGEGRVVYLPPEAWEVVAKWYEKRRTGRIISRFLFHRRGRPVKIFHAAWTNACERAGHPGMLFHDLRRTAVRNMVRSGITESVAMRITGHRTREVSERYNIVSEQDLRDAAEKMGTVSGTNGRPGLADSERS